MIYFNEKLFIEFYIDKIYVQVNMYVCVCVCVFIFE